MIEILERIKFGSQVKGFAEKSFSALSEAWNANLIQYFRGEGWELTSEGENYLNQHK